MKQHFERRVYGSPDPNATGDLLTVFYYRDKVIIKTRDKTFSLSPEASARLGSLLQDHRHLPGLLVELGA